MTTQTDAAFDMHLDQTTIKMLTWKPTVSTAIAVAIVQVFIQHPALNHWPDEIDLSWVSAKDKNLIGIAWRRLKNSGIISQTGSHRRSKSEDAGGRQIWQYRLESAALARTFLKRNGEIPRTNQLSLI
jgi:hypothetical protein